MVQHADKMITVTHSNTSLKREARTTLFQNRTNNRINSLSHTQHAGSYPQSLAPQHAGSWDATCNKINADRVMHYKNISVERFLFIAHLFQLSHWLEKTWVCSRKNNLFCTGKKGISTVHYYINILYRKPKLPDINRHLFDYAALKCLFSCCSVCPYLIAWVISSLQSELIPLDEMGSLIKVIFCAVFFCN